LQLDNEVSQSTDQPHGTVCHQHYTATGPVGERLQAGTEDVPLLDRPAPLRRLHDFGAAYVNNAEYLTYLLHCNDATLGLLETVIVIGKMCERNNRECGQCYIPASVLTVHDNVTVSRMCSHGEELTFMPTTMLLSSVALHPSLNSFEYSLSHVIRSVER